MNRYLYTIFTVTRINLRRFFRDKTSLFFTIAFPLLFLVIFGSLFGDKNSSTFNIVIINQSNTAFSKNIAKQLEHTSLYKATANLSLSKAESEMDRGQFNGIIVFPKNFGDLNKQNIPGGNITLYYDESNESTAEALQSSLSGFMQDVNISLTKYIAPISIISKSTNSPGETPFDFVFSGMLGFSILTLGLFGMTRNLPEMKKQNILRRYHTTPITKSQFIISLILQYIVMGLIAIAVLFAVGLHFYHLHMRGSYLNLLVILIISFITIFGIGLAIGGWAKDEQRAAPLTNLISFPMMFLSGTFFPTYIMPEWLQKISQYLPLTPIINSIRYIITENKSLIQVDAQIGLILIWMVVIYLIVIMSFRWDSDKV
jgi:ABC-2 type transport system permease protein